jgi:cyanate permease
MIALGSILRSTATTPSALLAFTFLYGIGMGWVWPNLPKLVCAWAPREKVGLFTGVYSAGIYAGAAFAIALTMPLIFPITNTFQGVFLIWGIPPIVAAILWWILVKEPPSNAVDCEPAIQVSTPFREVVQNRNLWLLSIFFLLYSFFLYSWVGWTPALLLLKGATPESAGLISSITMWIAIPAVFAITRLSHKLGLRKPFLWIPAIVLAGSAWGVINIGLSLSWLPMVIVAVAEASLLVTTLSLPIEMVPEKDVGAATGLMLGIGHAGALVGPWISGYLFDLTGNLNASFLLLVGIAIASVGIVFKLPETGPKARIKKQ